MPEGPADGLQALPWAQVAGQPPSSEHWTGGGRAPGQPLVLSDQTLQGWAFTLGQEGPLAWGHRAAVMAGVWVERKTLPSSHCGPR